MDALVISSVRKHLGRRIGIALALVLMIVVSLHLPTVQSVHATDAECDDTTMEGLRMRCVPYIKSDGTLEDKAQYLKCTDEVECDPIQGGSQAVKRCCVDPDEGVYGGNCYDPKIRDRKDLGVEDSTSEFIGLRPNNCDIDEDFIPPSGLMVLIVPYKEITEDDGTITKIDQSIADLYADRALHDINFRDWAGPDVGESLEGLPIIEETVLVQVWVNLSHFEQKGAKFYYQLDDDLNRRYFVKRFDFFPDGGYNAKYHLYEKAIGYTPKDPRNINTGGALGIFGLGNISCKIGNIFKVPLYNFVSAMTRGMTNSENLPDIAILCNKGTPQFENPDDIRFNDKGIIEGFVQDKCFCVDSTSGPGIAAVLLCTRFVAGLDNADAPWRSLIPNSHGSSRFTNLFFGGNPPTSSVDQFQNAVKTNTDEFFDDNGSEVEHWIVQLITQVSQSILVLPDQFNTRFFGQSDTPDVSVANDPSFVETFKRNHFVRQYIGCLSCAKYGGFPTALGCMPADRVDRFLTEGVLGIGIGIAGAISVLCIIYGAIQFQLSEGEAAKVQKAQKLITQCILGLLLILFSVFLLRFVGVNLLRIYGLG